MRVFEDNQTVGVVDPSHLLDVVLRDSVFFRAEAFTNISSLQVVNSMNHDSHFESFSSRFVEVGLNLVIEVVLADVLVGFLFEIVENFLFDFLLFERSRSRNLGLKDSLSDT